jgi:hypothetical protein
MRGGRDDLPRLSATFRATDRSGFFPLHLVASFLLTEVRVASAGFVLYYYV